MVFRSQEKMLGRGEKKEKMEVFSKEVVKIIKKCQKCVKYKKSKKLYAIIILKMIDKEKVCHLYYGGVCSGGYIINSK